MDPMIQLYYEESEEMLQKAEECMIRLEVEYSGVDINELFRIAHTIKGSSHMVGYADVGNLMHKIEDMLDCARNGSIPFNQSIVSLCFDGLDITKKMLLYKKEYGPDQMMESLAEEARHITERTEILICANKKVGVMAETQKTEAGIITSYLGKRSNEKNTYFITFFFEDDISMISPVLLMILNCVEEIGTLVYSSVDDNYFDGNGGDRELPSYDIILSTDTDEAELYANFDVTYVEKINIVDLSRSKVAQNDYRFMAVDNQLNVLILKALIQLCKIDLNKKIRMSSEEIEQMKSLHYQVIKAMASMKNNVKVAEFLEDFKTLYRMAVKSYDEQKIADQHFFLDFENKMAGFIENGFNDIKGKYVVSIFKAEKVNFISRLRIFIGKMNKTSTYIFLIDISQLTIVDEKELKDLIGIKRQLESKNIELGLIAEGPETRSIINIFDSIETIEKFQVSKSGTDAILKILRSEGFLKRISAKTDNINKL